MVSNPGPTTTGTHVPTQLETNDMDADISNSNQSPELTSRKLRHTQEGKFQCVECGQRIYSLFQLKYHYKHKHNMPNALQGFKKGCIHCGLIFRQVKEYNQHEKNAQRGIPCKNDVVLNSVNIGEEEATAKKQREPANYRRSQRPTPTQKAKKKASPPTIAPSLRPMSPISGNMKTEFSSLGGKSKVKVDYFKGKRQKLKHPTRTSEIEVVDLTNVPSPATPSPEGYDGDNSEEQLMSSLPTTQESPMTTSHNAPCDPPNVVSHEIDITEVITLPPAPILTPSPDRPTTLRPSITIPLRTYPPPPPAPPSISPRPSTSFVYPAPPLLSAAQQDLIRNQLNLQQYAGSINRAGLICNICNRRFCGIGYLNVHLISVHGIQLSQGTTNEFVAAANKTVEQSAADNNVLSTAVAPSNEAIIPQSQPVTIDSPEIPPVTDSSISISAGSFVTDLPNFTPSSSPLDQAHPLNFIEDADNNQHGIDYSKDPIGHLCLCGAHFCDKKALSEHVTDCTVEDYHRMVQSNPSSPWEPREMMYTPRTPTYQFPSNAQIREQ